MKSSPRFTMNLTLLVLVLLFVATPAVLAQDPANTSFKSDVEKAWKERIQRLSAYSSGSMTWAKQKKALMPDSQEEPAYMVASFEWKYKFPLLLAEGSSQGGEIPAAHIVEGCNQMYSFELEKRTESDEWAIQNVEPVLKKAKRPDLWEELLKNPPGNDLHSTFLRRSLFSEFILPDDRTSVVSLIMSPLCVVESFETLENGNVRMRFTIAGFEEKDENSQDAPAEFNFPAGSVDFTPNDWRVSAATLAHGSWEQSMVCEYKTDGDIPILVSKKVKRTLSIGAVTEDVLTFDLSNEKLDPAQVTLSYYGLPEPEFVSETNRIRLVLIALGALMIGFAVWRFSRRRSAEQ